MNTQTKSNEKLDNKSKKFDKVLVLLKEKIESETTLLDIIEEKDRIIKQVQMDHDNLLKKEKTYFSPSVLLKLNCN